MSADASSSASREAPRVRSDPGASLVLPGRFHAVVFDLDGVLIDSEPLWAAAEARLLARHGARHTDEDVAASHGRSIDASIAAYAERIGTSDRAALQAELLELMARRYAAGAPLRPGARRLVSRLAGRVPLAVASSTSGRLVRIALGGAGLLSAFDIVESGHDLGRPKPAPDVYLAACAALGVAPRDAIAFEDSVVGVRAAHEAGLLVAGVPDRPGIDLAVAGAHLVLDTLEDVSTEG